MFPTIEIILFLNEGNTMKKVFVHLSAATVCIFMSHCVLAGTPAEQKEAKKIVTNYKLLRSSCMEKQQKAKKVCFSRLKENNDAYVAAKRTLALMNKSKKHEDIHFVSFL